VDNPKLTSKMLSEEIFGPILPVVSVDDVDHAIKVIKSKGKPLAMHFYGNADGENKKKLMLHTSSGGFCVNDSWGHFNS